MQHASPNSAQPLHHPFTPTASKDGPPPRTGEDLRPHPMLRGTATTIGRARCLRRELSLPERLLWRELRRGSMGFRFRKQHPAGPSYVLDFACLEAKLAIEVDGEAHDRGINPAHDGARDEWLANQGFRTLRIPAREVLKNLEGVIAYIEETCRTQLLPGTGRGTTTRSVVVEGLAQLPQNGLEQTSPNPAQPLHQPTAGPPPRTGEDLEAR